MDLTRESKRRSTESGDHIIASNMFKTNTYASISLEQLVGNDIAKILRKEAAQTPEDNFPLEIKVQVISDGNKAYIRWTQLPDIPKIQAITGRQAP